MSAVNETELAALYAEYHRALAALMPQPIVPVSDAELDAELFGAELPK